MLGYGRVLLAVLILALAAAAVQPVYRVDRDVIFLPRNGVALNAHSGAVLWRFPRFQGQTSTDGQGLLLVSWVAVIQPALGNRRFTRVCRLRTRDGKSLWCRDFPDVQQWTLDAGGRSWYLHTPGRLQVLRVADGQPDCGFDLPRQGDLSLMPLPGRGVMVLDRDADRSHAEAFTYRPGAAALSGEVVPASIYPFRGDGHGLLFYAREKGEFFLGSPFTALFRRLRPPPAAAQFPRASLDAHGFFFTDWQGAAPVLRGGTYDGHLWQAPRGAADPLLALTAGSAVTLVADPKLHSTHLEAWNLESGQPRFTRTFAGDYSAVQSAGQDLVLQSPSDIRFLNADSGRERWRAPLHEGPLAAVAGTAVVFWEGQGGLAALARNNGALLWRIQFAQPLAP